MDNTESLPTSLSSLGDGPAAHTLLETHLTDLAHQVGYAVVWDELDPAIGLQSALAIDWILAGAHHASLTYARSQLASPIDFLTDAAQAEDDAGMAAFHLELLDDLRTVRHRLDADLHTATERYRRACAALAATDLGLLWPDRDTAETNTTGTATRVPEPPDQPVEGEL